MCAMISQSDAKSSSKTFLKSKYCSEGKRSSFWDFLDGKHSGLVYIEPTFSWTSLYLLSLYRDFTTSLEDIYHLIAKLC